MLVDNKDNWHFNWKPRQPTIDNLEQHLGWLSTLQQADQIWRVGGSLRKHQKECPEMIFEFLKRDSDVIFDAKRDF